MPKSCADARWSGFHSLFDIPDAEFEDFITHSDECAFHQAVLHKEERPLLEAACGARSLSNNGRVPVTPEEDAALGELAQNYQRWQKQATPLKSLSLRYRGEEVARHERVLQIIGTRVLKDLKEPGDLQIWKLPDDESPYHVLLGTYPLAGFVHTGTPRYYRLQSGQQIMLSVKQLQGDVYEIALACADMNELEDFLDQLPREQVVATKAASAKKAAAATATKGFTGFSSFNQVGAVPWYLLPTVANLSAAASIIMVFVLVTCMLPLVKLRPATSKRAARTRTTNGIRPVADTFVNAKLTAEPSVRSKSAARSADSRPDDGQFQRAVA